MANAYDFGAFEQPTGWLAYYRRVHDGQNSVLRHKGDDILFATELEALKAARVAFLDYVNSPIVGAQVQVPSIKAVKFQRANKFFKEAIEYATKTSEPDVSPSRLALTKTIIGGSNG